jgi:hypothetical protein
LWWLKKLSIGFGGLHQEEDGFARRYHHQWSLTRGRIQGIVKRMEVLLWRSIPACASRAVEFDLLTKSI